MKENFDSHQVVISREYFETLVNMAQASDYQAGTQNRPNQTMLARILRHVRKYNRPLHESRVEEVAVELKDWRDDRNQVIAFLNDHVPWHQNGNRRCVYVNVDAVLHEAVVLGIHPKDKLVVRLQLLGPKSWKKANYHISNIQSTK